MAKKNFFGIKIGRTSNTVVRTWDECSDLVTGYSGAIFRGFPDEADAIAFAAGNLTPPPKTPAEKARKKLRHKVIGPCLERKSYRCPVTHVYFNNRCIRRQGPTITGKYYQPSTDNSVPWND